MEYLVRRFLKEFCSTATKNGSSYKSITSKPALAKGSANTAQSCLCFLSVQADFQHWVRCDGGHGAGKDEVSFLEVEAEHANRCTVNGNLSGELHAAETEECALRVWAT